MSPYDLGRSFINPSRYAQAPEILADIAADEEPRPTLKKKEKQALKHELFIQREFPSYTLRYP